MLERGQNIRTIQELLGHRDVSKKTICTHVLNRGPLSEYAAQRTLCSVLNMWLSDP
ncbi:MAG TPA: hypothetical protein DDY43_09345 [Synechococcales bacterium UBA10510]|nr:hypothetical protein [Synechococcales bacterium UBA10510]